MPVWEEITLLPECASVGRAAEAIGVYGLLSNPSSYARLAGALCHLGLLGIAATHHLVVLLGAGPQASCFQGHEHPWGAGVAPLPILMSSHMGHYSPFQLVEGHKLLRKLMGLGRVWIGAAILGGRPFLLGE